MLTVLKDGRPHEVDRPNNFQQRSTHRVQIDLNRESVSVAPSPHGVKVSASGRTVTSFRDVDLDGFLWVRRMLACVSRCSADRFRVVRRKRQSQATRCVVPIRLSGWSCRDW
jgi:hypothetical protein